MSQQSGFSPFEPDAPRILLTGCPIGKGSEKVLRIIEECGGAVVCMENCTGVKGLDLLVDEEEKDPFLALARRYLQIPCSCITPNTGRLDLLDRLIDEYKIDGVARPYVAMLSYLQYRIAGRRRFCRKWPRFAVSPPGNGLFQFRSGAAANENRGFSRNGKMALIGSYCGTKSMVFRLGLPI